MRSTWPSTIGILLTLALVHLGAGQVRAIGDQARVEVLLPVASSGDGLPSGAATLGVSATARPVATPAPTSPPGPSAAASPIQTPRSTATPAPLSASASVPIGGRRGPVQPGQRDADAQLDCERQRDGHHRRDVDCHERDDVERQADGDRDRRGDGDRPRGRDGDERGAPTGSPTATATAAAEWTQFGHDAQRSGYTTQTVAAPWTYKWQWNGADGGGQPQADHLAVPDLVQPITGGGRIYMVAGDALTALNPTSGATLWSNRGLGALRATPAFADGALYVPSASGRLYKLDAATGATLGSFTTTSALDLAPLVVGGTVFAVGADGTLHAVDRGSMTEHWAHAGGSPGATPPSYSASRGLLVYVTQDLYVHAIDASSGRLRWRVKPTPRSYQCQPAFSDPCNVVDSTGAQAETGWPVIAEQHGLVFVRYRLDWATLWTWNAYPSTNAEIRADLIGRPDQQSLFALSLDGGAPAFVPAVGNGGNGDGGDLLMGPQPVVRVVDGREVAYVVWRNGLTCAGTGICDGREDATMGEMVLDGATVAGYQAGDVRFVRHEDIQTDEMMYLTMSGDTLFHNHWLVAAARTITDRGPARGGSFADPIQTTPAPYVIWRQAPDHGCAFDPTTRHCASLYSYGDERSYDTPGFYEYFGAAGSAGSTPFVVVSGDQVLVKTGDGGLMVFESGQMAAAAGQSLGPSPLALASADGARTGPTRRRALGAPPSAPISYREAAAHVDRTVTVEGVIASAVDHRPKAVYLGFTDPHDGALLVRIFEQDLARFGYDPLTLLGRRVRVTGRVTLYWPGGRDPEIIVTDPAQILVE